MLNSTDYVTQVGSKLKGVAVNFDGEQADDAKMEGVEQLRHEGQQFVNITEEVEEATPDLN